MANEIFKSLNLSLLNVEYCKLGTEWNYQQVVSPFSRLYFITEGECQVFHHGEKFVLQAGTVHLIPSFTTCNYVCENYFEQFYIHFIPELDSQYNIFDTMHFEYSRQATRQDEWLFQRLLQLNPNRGLFNHDPKIYQTKPYIKETTRSTYVQSARDLIESQGILLQLFSRLFADTDQHQPYSLEKFRRFGSILQFMQQNLHEKITLQQLADEACLAPDYFSRLFEQLTGFRPIEYINRKRIERSQLLLITTNENLETIARQAGFTSLSYFSRSFKKYTQTTPDAYRQQQLSW